MSKKADDQKTVVVVGGGHAGVHTSRPLSLALDPSKYKLILVNPRPYRIILPAALRLVVSDRDNLEETALVPYDKLFHNNNGTLVEDVVTAVQQEPGAKSGVLQLRSGESISYDILVLATGAAWQGPIAFPDDAEDVKKFIVSSRERYAKSNEFVLAGGGAVGVELAGEIKDMWPKKKVTIVHNSSQLLNGAYPAKYRGAVEKAVRARGIEILLDDEISSVPEDGNPVDGKVSTKKGKVLTADYVVRTWGARANTGFVASLGSDVLTNTGTVKIKPTFQLSNYANIFAAGDIIEWDEQKQAAKAKNHGAIIAANIVNYFTGKPLKDYKGSPELIALTNGKEGGVSYFGLLWGLMFGAWVTRLIKSRSLGVPFFRGEMGK
ncbi:FAD/NAD(P)-binding domain-containing protein [Gautieria morchelliformis]|nr:FAD/NAD(P)-binding domain-containing protein [Gautieria morchelliformis]